VALLPVVCLRTWGGVAVMGAACDIRLGPRRLRTCTLSVFRARLGRAMARARTRLATDLQAAVESAAVLLAQVHPLRP